MLKDKSDVEYYFTTAEDVCELIDSYISYQCDDDSPELVQELTAVTERINILCNNDQRLLIGECCGEVSFIALSPKGVNPLGWFKEGILYCTKYPFEDLVHLLDNFDYVEFKGMKV